MRLEEHVEDTPRATGQGRTGTEVSEQVEEWMARVLTSSPPIPPLWVPAPSFLLGACPSIILGPHGPFWGGCTAQKQPVSTFPLPWLLRLVQG